MSTKHGNIYIMISIYGIFMCKIDAVRKIVQNRWCTYTVQGDQKKTSNIP